MHRPDGLFVADSIGNAVHRLNDLNADDDALDFGESLLVAIGGDAVGLLDDDGVLHRHGA